MKLLIQVIDCKLLRQDKKHVPGAVWQAPQPAVVHPWSWTIHWLAEGTNTME
ncbi:MAG TPA: hypothetical protein V6D20_22770 [Candidatus Obscuribacterales bacterium]